MGRPLKIEWQETAAELYEKYKGEKDHQNRTRLQVLWQAFCANIGETKDLN